MIKAVVFDVYGTLLDTRGCSLVIMKNVLEKCNCSLSPKFVYGEWRKDIEKMIMEMKTESQFETERVFFKKALGKTLKRLKIRRNEHENMKLYNELCWGHRSILPDTKKALGRLKKKYKIYIASNSDTKPLLKDFKRYGLKANKILASEMLRAYKPHKKFFINMLKKLNFKKNEILYVGDTLSNDVAGPHKAGIKAVWLNRKNKRRKFNEAKPDFTVKNLEQLISLKI